MGLGPEPLGNNIYQVGKRQSIAVWLVFAYPQVVALWLLLAAINRSLIGGLLSWGCLGVMYTEDHHDAPDCMISLAVDGE